MTWPINCILNGWRPSTGLSKRQSSRSRDSLKATKQKTLAPSPTTNGLLCPSSLPRDHGNPTISEGAKVTGMEKSQSLFMSKLPLELRIMIYEEVLCKPVDVVHITIRKDGKLVYFRCQAEEGRCRGLECFHGPSEDIYGTWRTRDKDLFCTWSPSNMPNTAEGGLLGLLQTCRQVSVSLSLCSSCRCTLTVLQLHRSHKHTLHPQHFQFHGTTNPPPFHLCDFARKLELYSDSPV